MQIHIQIDEAELRKILLRHIEGILGDVSIEEKDIQIQVKSKQNYKSEWESASFRAVVNKPIA